MTAGSGTERRGGEPTERADLPRPSDAVAALFGDSLATAARYAELLATAGIERGLLGPREMPRIWDRHLANSAVVAALVPDSAYLIDLGSGAGLPGIPLACVRSDIRVELVEPQLRRVRFLEQCVGELDLPHVTVTRARAEELAGRGADCVVARALAPLDRLVPLAMPVLREGGLLLAIKGERAEEELARSEDAIRVTAGNRARLRMCGEGVVDPPVRVVVVKKSR